MKPWKRAKTGVGEGPKMVERGFICVKIFFFYVLRLIMAHKFIHCC